MRWSGLLLLVSLLAAPATTGCGPGPQVPPPSAPSEQLNRRLPSFKRPALDGRMVDTTSASGQITVVKFFAKYCKPCRKTLPAAERLHQEHQDVRFIGVDVDEHSSEAAEMVASYALTFAVLHDEGTLLAERFGVTKLPATFVADSSGTVRWVAGERQTEEDLALAIAWIKRGAAGPGRGTP